ncbi:TPA: retron system putative HNH endonuclease [Stenotrophomonas maltophilia]
MKHVQKQEAPESFERWKAQANDDWQPTYADLQNPEKAQLQEALLSEQGWVCCYCGRSIEQAHSHIEHFRPQEHYPDRVLSYDNLHASCIRETSPGTPLHCGHAKGNAFDEALAISPTTPGCEQQFRYTLDGQIIPENDNAAYMCNFLKLDIEFLNDRRAAVLQGVFDNDFSGERQHGRTESSARRLQAARCRWPSPGFRPYRGALCRTIDGGGGCVTPPTSSKNSTRSMSPPASRPSAPANWANP